MTVINLLHKAIETDVERVRDQLQKRVYVDMPRVWGAIAAHLGGTWKVTSCAEPEHWRKGTRSWVRVERADGLRLWLACEAGTSANPIIVVSMGRYQKPSGEWVDSRAIANALKLKSEPRAKFNLLKYRPDTLARAILRRVLHDANAMLPEVQKVLFGDTLRLQRLANVATALGDIPGVTVDADRNNAHEYRIQSDDYTIAAQLGYDGSYLRVSAFSLHGADQADLVRRFAALVKAATRPSKEAVSV